MIKKHNHDEPACRSDPSMFSFSTVPPATRSRGLPTDRFELPPFPRHRPGALSGSGTHTPTTGSRLSSQQFLTHTTPLLSLPHCKLRLDSGPRQVPTPHTKPNTLFAKQTKPPAHPSAAPSPLCSAPSPIPSNSPLGPRHKRLI
ncbi:uncharacterized protein K452DRAFT_50635 [Aplosporella prunicola CBS 121167]|uniref:Uncharacterized protein n=1 Tax=Aplosporella prunicola CBS 121167 TaxID=1176127 RepID=A0A6A6BBV2_9PEZI|nr:uncharacterized protein K452DRAFT_50635 [Aplosporella prunicola CBS 121167]KAF2140734.1 hypothetical protein K452DRAFT_50635 [Aplosporella prunicola CBS 121167]